ncbi:alpha-L-rhamnosidase [Marinoscillum pacificum]|uniref:alpha-L-rhamnosidase n=1 Tax=Marinoscillum pacificum TaxID=392723 RepID=UPI002157EBBC|nr:alpha-L-rhamnosidase [Marinoscillum pacificum]
MRHLVFLLLLLTGGLGFSQKLSVADLTVEFKSNPIGIDEEHPRFSWKLNAERNNTKQAAFELQVAMEKQFKNLEWGTGKVESDQSILVSYDGENLVPNQRYYWRVRVWDNYKKRSDWSTPQYWVTGMINPSNWKAMWIEPIQEEKHSGPAAMVRKTFSTSKKVTSARAYVSAHGLYELHLNGEVVGDQVFAPGWTSYEERIQYQVYDVTSNIQQGENVIGAYIGDGWYRGQLAWGPNNWAHYGHKIGLICQVEITYQDGSKETIVSDEKWKGTMDGPITMNSLYNGEHYDARKEKSGWNSTKFDDSDWQQVTVSAEGAEKLISTQTVPVRRIEEIKPVKIWKTPMGTLVADMGQNMVGWVKLKVNGPAGTQVTIRHAEVLDSDGEFYTDNLRAAQATLMYTLKGDGDEVYEPRFTFMGFRYLAIEGFPGELTEENLTGVVIHSDMEPTGSFECSNPQLNQLQHNIQWGQKGNFLDVPTDCPQRDERLGWTGDAQAFIRTASFNMNVAPFFTKWLQDIPIAQDSAGIVPFVVPYVMEDFRASAGWADVVTIAPWTMYEVYGDRQILSQLYPAMKKYVNYVQQSAGDDYLWQGGSVFGDWLFYKPELKFWTEPDGHTDPDLIATAFYAYSVSILANTAEVLGKNREADEYRELFLEIKKAFNQAYVTPSGLILSDSQTSYVLALMFDLLDDAQRDGAIDRLVHNIRNRGNHLSTGFLGTPYLCRVLSDNGRADVAYDLLLQETFPSWIYPITMGATTIWERWDGQKPDGSFQNTDMNSFNHYAYGAIGDWMYRVVAGIDNAAPGYKELLLNPHPDSRLGYAKASFESSYGLIESSWRMDSTALAISVTIPPNTTGKVVLPDAVDKEVLMNNRALTIATKTSGSDLVLQLGSGKYEFKILNNE